MRPVHKEPVFFYAERSEHMKKEIVFIDDDTLTPEELAMFSDEFGVEFVKRLNPLPHLKVAGDFLRDIKNRN